MGFNYNQATLVGRLTKDPEQKEINENIVKTYFTLAVNRPYRKSDGEFDTDYIPVTMWGRTGDIGYQLLKKGSPVLVTGKIQVTRYKKEDESRWITEIVGDTFQILEKKHHFSEDDAPIEEEGKKKK